MALPGSFFRSAFQPSTVYPAAFASACGFGRDAEGCRRRGDREDLVRAQPEERPGGARPGRDVEDLLLGRGALVAEIHERRPEPLVVLLAQLQDVAQLAERRRRLLRRDVRGRADLRHDLREGGDLCRRDAERPGRLADLRQRRERRRHRLGEAEELLAQLRHLWRGSADGLDYRRPFLLEARRALHAERHGSDHGEHADLRARADRVEDGVPPAARTLRLRGARGHRRCRRLL
jgi:hypothetical protein